MKKLPDWKERRHAYLVSHANDPFKYGRIDCAKFVADVLVAMYGERDNLEDFRTSAYSDRSGAYMFVRSHGGFARAISAVLGTRARLWTEDTVLEDGDVVLINNKGDWFPNSCGVVINGKVMAKHASGVVVLPNYVVVKYWRL